MDNRPLRVELHNRELLEKFNRIHAESIKIWDEQNLPTYTEHGPLHTQQIEKNLYALTRPLKKPLSPQELFILLSAACLHDIGMQLSDDPNVRRKHAEAVFELIVNSDRPRAGFGIVLPIDDDKERIAIAKVARAHWTDHALVLPPIDFLNNRNEDGRLKLLGLLLAMADLLDLSPVRARYFRTIHRFYGLPPESELHQKMHKTVWGTHIRPPKVPTELQFQIEWANDSEIVHLMNDWVMQSFNSQWRQLQAPLFEESKGTIGWAKPWMDVSYRHEQSNPELSPAAQNVLTAERADQVRVDRNAFASCFLASLKNKEAAVFLLPREDEGDWPNLCDWSEAYARLHSNTQIAKVNFEVTQYLAGTITDMMEQWEHPLSPQSPDEPFKQLQTFLADTNSPDLVSIIRTDDPFSDALESFIKTLVLPNGTAARICLVICPKGKEPTEFRAAKSVALDSTMPVEEIEQYLQARHGYGADESKRFCKVMLLLELTPRRVYTYIEQHCSRIDW